MILCIGEILVDLIGKHLDENVVYERKAGGAPFNVCCAIKKLGGETGFIGACGDDIFGKYLVEYASFRNFDKCDINIVAERNTTLAIVEIDENAERKFSFYRKNTADCYLPKIEEKLIKTSKIVHLGSLMLSDDIGYKTVKDVINIASNNNVLISFDINYRSGIFNDEKEMIAKYKSIIEAADIVKISEEEVELFGMSYLKMFPEKLIIITKGKMGSMWMYKNIRHNISTIKVDAVDTTGAGDAFFGGVLFKLSSLDKKMWEIGILDKIVYFGNICGALNTLKNGAIDALPTISEVEKYLK